MEEYVDAAEEQDIQFSVPRRRPPAATIQPSFYRRLVRPSSVHAYRVHPAGPPQHTQVLWVRQVRPDNWRAVRRLIVFTNVYLPLVVGTSSYIIKTKLNITQKHKSREHFEII